MEALSSEEATKRWEFLMGIENVTSTNATRSQKRKRPVVSSKKAISDPFDCTSMKILPTQDLVQNTIQEYLEEWKKLEDRRISQKPPTALDDDDSEDSIPKGTNHGGGWRAREDRLFLPDGFEYNQKCPDQQQQQRDNEVPVSDDYTGDVIVSLKNPTHRLSYCDELSKLFHVIPSSRDLENEARRGHKVDNTLRLYQETHDPKIIPDSYTVARLRVPDRHGLPQSLQTAKSTVLLEFWRKIPKPTSTGCHRMIVEFLASQSLWDVHVILSQMAEDELWDESDDKISVDAILESGDNDDTIHHKGNCPQNRSGCFFIENIFYKTGSVDYTKPIIDWVEGSDSNNANAIRKTYLGINSCSKETKEMKATTLNQVPFRLNVRYYHACHGNVETTVMFVDRKLIRPKVDSNRNGDASYPLIHDIWTAPRLPNVPICDACQIYQSVFKTPTDCKRTDGGPHSLCQECFEDLKLQKEPNSVKFYRKWNDQAILTNTFASENNTSS